MTLLPQLTQPSSSQTHGQTSSDLIRAFFQFSEGKWRSERRYYTLPEGPTEELVSIVTVEFLEPGHVSLLELGSLHQLSLAECEALCGSKVYWESTDSRNGKKKSAGSTVFGALNSILYRDRGFATLNPVTAKFYLPNPETLCLRTEYNGSVFEEEIKHIGQQYRTRQSIMSRAGEQIMIGQYLEKRIQ
ncbi:MULTISPECIES: phycobiliprotein lyase [Planktothricoides]|uniref:Chromophore lyase CpcS/CpeS n=2 Tax=Planktothricoides raciborskii TaxID=132608 RepID=A0AAU8JBA9_9CYAN|nr:MULTISPECIES: phycobiliprotein lyase [Planktothricoides]MBD2545804.1 phycobiliprotein lyase [Planktothricoides raciborskii FACHB-1370]MBD2583975.1 phycobiliprotein lyase [Planktothricoides raciborskii FACHB-1261]